MNSAASPATLGPRYKWIALSNTTLGVLIATINSSILLIALPDIFRGLKIDPLAPGNSSYLLWLIMGYLVVTAVLVVTFGRLGDMYGRVKMFNAGFAIFTFFSIALSVVWLDRHRRRALPDHHAHPAGRRRRAADGQLQRDHHRRVPRRPARARARPEHGGRHRRLVPRPGDRRRARPGRLAPRLPGLGAVQPLRHGLGLPQAARPQPAPPPRHGLVGQHHLRPRPDRRPGRDHLRHPALRQPHHGLDQPVGAGLDRSAAWPCSRSSA